MVAMAGLTVIRLMLVTAAVMVVVEFLFLFHSILFRILHVLYSKCIFLSVSYFLAQ